MDYIKEFLQKTLSQYVEGVNEKTLTLGFNEGVEINNLTLRTDIVNHVLQNNGVDARLDYGRIGKLRLVYTALPGIVTMQVDGLDIRMRPNFTGTAIKKICETLGELQEDVDEAQMVGLVPSATPYGIPCPPPIYPQCAFSPQQPEVHDTFSRRLPPHRVPRPPPVVRRARYVMPKASVAQLVAVPAPTPSPRLPVASPTLPRCDLQVPSFEAPALPPLCENVYGFIEGCSDTLAKITTPAHENFSEVPVSPYQCCPKPSQDTPVHQAYLLPPVEQRGCFALQRRPQVITAPSPSSTKTQHVSFVSCTPR
ncbi:amine-terminal region of chorein, A TM vesicle-mediated sorter [Toxoplasma gondii RUB]|uniref:Amine-terminal region of chorein, A TM vesicle-mediated sorter n=1 Tax=Toxoplasma gondii RUB TaxID=935652 RepID=A0A086LST2_TOXGO|nr:amine-terminal region of chorein, A TM vesicle-mediated sorter [Toxoplasma gondii RUB]